MTNPYIITEIAEQLHLSILGRSMRQSVEIIITALAAAEKRWREARAPIKAKPLDKWHEDMRDVVWWKFPIEEAGWIGTPNDENWPGYHTHWTPHPEIPEFETKP